MKEDAEAFNTQACNTCPLPPCSKAVKAWIAERNVKRAVVVGAGFIGMEMAENLVHLGIETHVVEMGPQVRAGAGAKEAT